jgi:hypothetical protein
VGAAGRLTDQVVIMDEPQAKARQADLCGRILPRAKVKLPDNTIVERESEEVVAMVRTKQAELVAFDCPISPPPASARKPREA